jgi:hypothetical protein
MEIHNSKIACCLLRLAYISIFKWGKESRSVRPIVFLFLGAVWYDTFARDSASLCWHWLGKLLLLGVGMLLRAAMQLARLVWLLRGWYSLEEGQMLLLRPSAA